MPDETAVQPPDELRRYGASMQNCTQADWGTVRAAVIQRGAIGDVEQHFCLPRHVFRLGLSGRHHRGSTTALGDLAPVPIPERETSVSFYPAGTPITNVLVGTTPLIYMTVEIETVRGDEVDRLLAPALRPIVDVRNPLIEAVLLSLARDIIDTGTLQRLFAEAAATMLMVEAARQSSGTTSPPMSDLPKGGLAARQLDRTLEILEARIAEQIPLSDLAAKAGLSVSHFCRAFRRSTGTTPHQWQLDRRIARAKHILRTSQATLSEVALATGFYDQAHFTKLFGKSVGSTPGAWRRHL